MNDLSGTQIKTPDFEHATNYKEFFLRDDSLSNLRTELVFSIFERYMCKAGCKMCYVQHDWIDDNQFPGFVPTLTEEAERRIIEAFGYFEIVTTMDDLYLLKHKYPLLYEFYKRNSHLMSSTAMSDVAFIQQHPIIMEEMNFKSVYEVSFSDEFLSKNNGKNVDVIIDKLDEVLTKYQIMKIKIILRQSASDDGPEVSKLMDWAKRHNIFIDIHDDILQQRNIRYVLKTADFQETNHVTVANHVHLILCEVVYLQFTSMFLSISDAMKANSAPFYDVVQQSIGDPDFLKAALKEKISLYGQNLAMFNQSCETINERHNLTKYHDYFQYVFTSASVNEQYTFVPHFMLSPSSTLYRRLAEGAFCDTKYGLLLRGATQAVPIVSMSAKPKIRIEHIPIKCATTP